MASVWILMSLLFLDAAWARVADLRAAHRYVSVWRESQVAFWVIILMFWLWNGWTGWKLYRAERRAA